IWRRACGAHAGSVGSPACSTTRREGSDTVVRKVFVPTLSALITAAVVAGATMAGTHGAAKKVPAGSRAAYAIGLWGDVPYSPEQATIGVPNLIVDMNSQKLAFTVNDGDLKAGSTECSDAVYTQALVFFDALR